MSAFRMFPKVTALTCALTMLASCSGGGGGGGTSGGGTGGSTYGTYQSSSVTVSEFVSALNRIEGYGANASEVELYTDETIRSSYVGEDDWFVIWDDKYNEYKAVSLQYIRAIVYYDYYANSTALAEEFRDIETDDILAGDINGDYWGDDYEVVDWDSWTGTFVGRRSGFDYEDGAASTDVSLATAEVEQREFFQKAAKISYAFNVGIETSLSLVSLGQKAEQMLQRSSGELTAADQAAFANDLQHLAGVTLADVVAASTDEAAQSDLVNKVATKIGTSAANLETRILPELFGVELN